MAAEYSEVKPGPGSKIVLCVSLSGPGSNMSKTAFAYVSFVSQKVVLALSPEAGDSARIDSPVWSENSGPCVVRHA